MGTRFDPTFAPPITDKEMCLLENAVVLVDAQTKYIRMLMDAKLISEAQFAEAQYILNDCKAIVRTYYCA